MKHSIKILVCILIVNLCFFSSITAHAAPNEWISTSDKATIHCDDGSVITIIIAVDKNKASGTISGTKTYVCSNNGSALWTAALNASFNYTGYSSGCTAANCQVTFQNSHYSLKDKTVTVSGNTAIATITVVHKVLGITISTTTHTLTLSCDSNGNLS